MQVGQCVKFNGIKFRIVSIWEDGADSSLDHVEIRNNVETMIVTREYLEEV